MELRENVTEFVRGRIALGEEPADLADAETITTIAPRVRVARENRVTARENLTCRQQQDAGSAASWAPLSLAYGTFGGAEIAAELHRGRQIRVPMRQLPQGLR